jgi:hypothetical protein
MQSFVEPAPPRTSKQASSMQIVMLIVTATCNEPKKVTYLLIISLQPKNTNHAIN